MKKQTLEPAKKVKTIIQPYDLTVAHFDFSVDEMRVLLRIVEHLQEDMSKNIQLDLFTNKALTVIVPVQNLLPKNSNNYSRVKTALTTLRERTLVIKGEEKETITGVIKEADYFNNNKSVSIEISKAMVPRFLELKRGFTVFGIEAAFNLESSYAMRFYQIICQWKDLPYKDYKVDDLRDMLMCKEKYATTGVFKLKVIDPARELIKTNALTDRYFTYSDLKEGTKIVAIRIFIHKKSATGFLDQDIESRNFTELITLLKRHFKLTDEQVKEFVKDVNAFRDNQSLLIKSMELYSIYSKSADSIRDPASWVITGLTNYMRESESA